MKCIMCDGTGKLATRYELQCDDCGDSIIVQPQYTDRFSRGYRFCRDGAYMVVDEINYKCRACDGLGEVADPVAGDKA